MERYLLPQADRESSRAQRIADARASYAYGHELGFPLAHCLPAAERPHAAWRLKLLAVLESLRVNLRVLKAEGQWQFVRELPPLAPLKLAEMIHANDVAGLVDYFIPVPGGTRDGPRARRLDEFRQVFAVPAVPTVARRFETDEYFAEVMVAGPDPTRLERLAAVPGKFPITTEHLQSVPHCAGDNLESAIASGRVYWIDQAPLSALEDGRHPQSPKFMYAPMAAFCVPRSGGVMRPFAIQCGQDPAGREIYTPDDGYSWKLAKNCVLAAHNTYHEILSHLGFTHLMSEPILLATVRNLATAHPVSALLRRHLEGTLYINKLAVELLLQPGRAVDYLIGSDLKTTYAWLGEHRRKRSYRQHYLPARLSTLGTASPGTLPYYPYRDDGLLVWEALARWVQTFVEAYYRSDADVAGDWELQAWSSEITSADGGAIRDFGATPGRILDRQDLAEVLTMAIWTAGPQHAAVNFAQKEHMAFLPANPLAGYTPVPVGRQHSKDDWLANLPPIDVAVQQYCVMTLLGSVYHTTLSEYGSDFRKTAASGAHARFVSDLQAIEDEISARNRRRPVPYERLLPSNIPNSTNI